MSQVSSADVVNLFKKVYGNINDLQPEDYMLQKDIPFTEKQKVGESYSEAVILTAETGWTLGSNDAFELNPAIAGAVKQTTVSPSPTVLASVVPWTVLSRSAGGGEKAFVSGTKHIVKNNLKSHGKLLEIIRLYGQADKKLGYVSYATATYRNVAFTNGSGTLTVNGSSVAFTNGVNTSEKMILVKPGDFAAGIWVGSEGAILKQINSSGAVVAEGKLVGVDADMGVLVVDFVPVAASSTSSHRLCFDGMESVKDAMGVHKILSSNSSLFGISNTQYSLWKGNNIALNSVKFTFDRLQTGVAAAVNRGGLDGDLNIYVNPRTWGTLISTEAAKRMYDSSYKTNEADNGSEAIVFYHQAGKAIIKSHRMVMEGDVFGLHAADWSRSGSAEISMSVPGVDKDLIYPLENQAAYAFRTFSDQYVFCHAPARSLLWSGISDESAS